MNIFTILLTQPLANGLVLFYKVLGENMGLAIIVFTLALRILLQPLSKSFLESSKKMRDLAPQIAKIKKRHQGDMMKQNQAVAEFYRQKGVKPIGPGCLLQILQFAILIAFFQFFSGTFSANGNIIEKLNLLLYEPLRLDPAGQINTHFLYLDITRPDVFAIPGIPFPIPGLVVILAAIAQMISAKITSPYLESAKKAAQKTPEAADDFQASMQSSLIYSIPLMTVLFGVSLSSGVLLYWLTFSVFQAVQQYRSSGWGGMTPWVAKLKALAK